MKQIDRSLPAELAQPQQNQIIDGVISFIFKDLQSLGGPKHNFTMRQGPLFKRKTNERLPTREYQPFSSNVSPETLERRKIDISESTKKTKQIKRFFVDPTKKVSV